ncbi:MCP four helix bundle domain-containing protein [Parafilimonas terrae]|jgi:hypothetical protein|uniref:Four helix bundle sensory module for signal transduction n=1 Tax=Parafilimonas terrae TaxID=1465490 RepID=A0A1I5Y511_9BACT|nr:MCP four helix bundle domain-containing protein [Parafilimonas terrae]SFQ39180.1 Four helix bundle sensory module for signal transduction [Parafilimonas terrae]
MKWAYLVKDKMKAVAVLLLIIVLILVNNISNRKTFSKLNESIASIYKDRLMPATYIFQLTDHLYQKKFLLNEMQANDNAAIAARHDSAIHSIIKTYETTYLTPAEKKHWLAFKKELEQYNTLTSGLEENNKAVNESFENVIQHLNALSEIQASEGSNIFSIAKIDVGGTIIMSHLEVALLLILGIFALVLINANDNKLMQVQKARLN